MPRPNRLTIPPAAGGIAGVVRVTTEGTALVQALGVPERTIKAWPGDGKDPSSFQSPTDAYRAGIDLVLPAPGIWTLYNEGSVGLDVLILDFSCCCEAALYYARGGFVVATNTFATVGVASAVALAANVNRRAATFVNDSANTVYLAFGAAAVVGSGIRLNANGGSFTMELGSKLFTLLDVRAIAGGAGSNMTIVEAT